MKRTCEFQPADGLFYAQRLIQKEVGYLNQIPAENILNMRVPSGRVANKRR